MAKQTGPMKIIGTTDNMIFYRKGDVYLSKQKSPSAPKDLPKGKGYNHQRAGILEFTQAEKAGKLLYKAFADTSDLAKGPDCNARLLKNILKVLKTDELNEAGQRNILDGEIRLLEGFEFNDTMPLCKILLTPYSALIDRKTSRMTLRIHELEPEKMIDMPHATHFKLEIAGSAVDFLNNRYLTAIIHSTELPVYKTLQEEVALTVELPPNSQHPFFLALGVSFFQELNGIRRPLKPCYNAMAFVKVLGI